MFTVKELGGRGGPTGECAWDWPGGLGAGRLWRPGVGWGSGGAGPLLPSQVTCRQAARSSRKFREREGGVGKGEGGDGGWQSVG